MNSGYWFRICLDISEAWDVCRQVVQGEPNDDPNVPVYDCLAQEEETEEEKAERCHPSLYENMCRNSLLSYYAQMRES